MQLICHCQDCRDATGDDYSTTAFFKTDACQISGDTVDTTFVTDEGTTTTRQACGKCGCFLFDRSERFRQLVGVFANRLASPFVVTPQGHIWTSSRLPHVTTDPDLPEYPKGIS